MTDIENQIFTEIKNAITVVYPNANVVGTYINTVKQLPTVSVEEISNYTWRASLPLNLQEKNAHITYEINIFTNGNNAKSTAKSIRNIVDSTISSYGAIRIMGAPIPNIDDATIYRYTLRYQMIK